MCRIAQLIRWEPFRLKPKRRAGFWQVGQNISANPFSKGGFAVEWCLQGLHSGVYPPDCGCPRFPAKDSGGFLCRPIVHTKTIQHRSVGIAFSVFRVYAYGMKTTRKTRRGRPCKGSDKIKGIRLDMRLEVAEKEGFRAAAELSGLDLSAWIRERLRCTAKDELVEAGREVPFLKGK